MKTPIHLPRVAHVLFACVLALFVCAGPAWAASAKEIDIRVNGALDRFKNVDIKDSIVGFVFNNKGLMYNLTLEGSKFTKIVR